MAQTGTDYRRERSNLSQRYREDEDFDVAPQRFEEGELTKKIEKKTSRIPSGLYLGLALGSMAASLAVAMKEEKKSWSNFIGLWAPTILVMGLYNKIVKVEDSDRQSTTVH